MVIFLKIKTRFIYTLPSKKDEDTTVFFISSEGTVDFKSGDYAVGSSVTFQAKLMSLYWIIINYESISVNENTLVLVFIFFW